MKMRKLFLRSLRKGIWNLEMKKVSKKKEGILWKGKGRKHRIWELETGHRNIIRQENTKKVNFNKF